MLLLNLQQAEKQRKETHNGIHWRNKYVKRMEDVGADTI
ncbi:MAG: hypothetical protein ACI8RD_003525 [Bacillariaceae sp.]|jgi:hypothetical protein